MLTAAPSSISLEVGQAKTFEVTSDATLLTFKVLTDILDYITVDPPGGLWGLGRKKTFKVTANADVGLSLPVQGHVVVESGSGDESVEVLVGVRAVGTPPPFPNPDPPTGGGGPPGGGGGLGPPPYPGAYNPIKTIITFPSKKIAMAPLNIVEILRNDGVGFACYYISASEDHTSILIARSVLVTQVSINAATAPNRVIEPQETSTILVADIRKIRTLSRSKKSDRASLSLQEGGQIV